MQAHFGIVHQRPSSALADYDFLRSTYEMLLRSPAPNYSAIHAAFEALDAAHDRLRVAHLRLSEGLSLKAVH